MTNTTDKCLDRHAAVNGGTSCEGEIEGDWSRSGLTFMSRCQTHRWEWLDRQAEIDERYPDSPHAPSDFDPTYAGERWDDDY